MIIQVKLTPIESVDKVPVSILKDWFIVRVDKECYFCGTSMHSNKTRTSTAIVNFDPVRLKGQTSSGRVYELVGTPLNENQTQLEIALLFPGGVNAIGEFGLDNLHSKKMKFN